MKKLKLLVAAFLTIASHAYAAIVLDFNHTVAQNGTSVGNSYAADGIVFSSTYFNNDLGGYWISGEPDTATMNGILNQPITGSFIAGVTDSLSAIVKFPDVGTVTTLDVYDVSNNLIGSASSVAGGLSVSVAVSGISSFRFSWSNAINSSRDDIIGLDQLTFNTLTAVPVPEPEIYAMLGVGLGFMGWVVKRRKQQAA